MDIAAAGQQQQHGGQLQDDHCGCDGHLGTMIYQKEFYNSNSTVCLESVEQSLTSLKTTKVVRSRDRKFHKRFKNLPELEKVLKVYHCAYVSDILLQGYLYITSDNFCFYSKILGRERLIEISICDVVDVTREKTAFIIPNAIGIHTVDNSKYVFGSLVSRNRTYHLMSSIWKRVMSNDHFGSLPASRDVPHDSHLTYKREIGRSGSSVDGKTSSDESYFTDPEYQATSSQTNRQTSIANLNWSSPTKSINTGPQRSNSCSRKISNTRSPPQDINTSHACKTSTILDIDNSPNGFIAFLSSVTPIAWWTFACTFLTLLLALYGVIIFGKVFTLQNEIMYHLYQRNIKESTKINSRFRLFNFSNLEGEQRSDKTKIYLSLLDEYTHATDRLLMTAENLQSVLQSNMELIIQVCKLLKTITMDNKNKSLGSTEDVVD